ncbi:YdbL family protein [Azospirillum halopraeferens]|uniref:YdbL family protein n=1 Tax=Azospirillum halopraeferens TaxID=34010 RepID=UPI00048A4C54|nr:YdbL family protein [Azospirillum halopraeferens]
MTRRLTILMLALALALPAAMPFTALAQDPLAAAKAAGQAGERPDGLVGALPGAPGDVQALVQQVNAQRMDRYNQIARANGTSVDKVQAIAGQELIGRTPPGQFIMTPGGAWARK